MFKHITKRAYRLRHNTIRITSPSQEMELVITPREQGLLKRRFFIEIDELVTDEILGGLIGLSRTEGKLLE